MLAILNNLDITKKFSIVNISVILFYFIPISLITGPFLPDLSISLIGLFYIFYRKKEIIIDIKKNKFIQLFFMFCLYIVVRSLFSSNILLSLESSLFFFRFGFFTLAIIYLIQNKYINLKKLMIIYIIIILFISLDCIFQFITNYNFIGLKAYGNRLTSFFTGYNGRYNDLIVGNYLCRLIPISIALIFFNIKILNKRLIILILIYLNFVSLATFLTGERVTLLFIFFTYLSLIIIKSSLKKYMILNCLILIFISIGFVSSKPIFKERIVDLTINQIKFSSENKFNIISSAHHPIIMNGVNIFMDNRLIGIGTKLFREECKLYDIKGCNTHPHNSYIQLLAETGLIGFSFLLFYFLFISKKIFAFVREKNLLSNDDLGYYTLLVLIFTNFFIYQPNMSIFHNWIAILYFLPISIILSFDDIRKFKI